MPVTHTDKRDVTHISVHLLSLVLLHEAPHLKWMYLSGGKACEVNVDAIHSQQQMNSNAKWLFKKKFLKQLRSPPLVCLVVGSAVGLAKEI